ncbi:MAG: hypothetical protein AMXMBFR59_38420 [Rhodanobacteraceae bacterium]
MQQIDRLEIAAQHRAQPQARGLEHGNRAEAVAHGGLSGTGTHDAVPPARVASPHFIVCDAGLLESMPATIAGSKAWPPY